jgi:hypothetical protein
MDEYYVYIIRDVVLDKNNPTLRKVKNHHDLRNIVNIVIDQIDDNKLHFNMIFSKTEELDEYETKSKQMLFENDSGQVFFKMLRYYFNKLNIPITMNDNN